MDSQNILNLNIDSQLLCKFNNHYSYFSFVYRVILVASRTNFMINSYSFHTFYHIRLLSSDLLYFSKSSQQDNIEIKWSTNTSAGSTKNLNNESDSALQIFDWTLADAIYICARWKNKQDNNYFDSKCFNKL